MSVRLGLGGLYEIAYDTPDDRPPCSVMLN